MSKASQLKSGKEMILRNDSPLNQNSVMVACDCSSVHWQIDFVAHDDIPYSSAGSDDVYKHIKEAGKGNFTFLALSFSASAQILLLPFDRNCWERRSRVNITFSYTLAVGSADFSRKIHFVNHKGCPLLNSCCNSQETIQMCCERVLYRLLKQF